MNSFDAQRLTQSRYYSSFSSNTEIPLKLAQHKSYIINTIDNLGYDQNLDKQCEFLNPLSGPFSLEGIRNGDTIAIHIEKISHTRNIGLSSSGILPENINPEFRKSVLGEAVTFWKIEGNNCYPIVDKQISPAIALRKALMIGCLRSADACVKAPLNSLDADQHGGNFDCKLFKEGAIVFLPILNKNAIFYFGDVHYCQSDGEVGGSGIEVSAEIIFSAELCPEPLHKGIHVKVDESVYFFGVAPTINECISKAFSQGYEALTSRGIHEDLTRLLLAHSSELRIVKLGKPNIVAVGIKSQYIS